MSTSTAVPRPVTPVGILAAELVGLVRDLGPGLAPVALERLERARDLAVGLEPYVGACTTPESPALARLAERTAAEDWSRYGPAQRARGGVHLEQEMLSGHVEGQLLKLLVRTTGATRVLEIGMFTGYAALAMAEALPEAGTVTACEIDADVAAFARRCFDDSPAGSRISVEVGPAADTLARLAAAGRSFDLVFVDADKASYAGYLDTLLTTGLLASGGLVCVDNTLLQGEPYLAAEPTANGAAIANFNRILADDPRVEQVLLPLRDGLTLVRRADADG